MAVEPHLTLSAGQSQHSMAKVGLCLTLAGGFTHDGIWTNTLVEVLEV